MISLAACSSASQAVRHRLTGRGACITESHSLPPYTTWATQRKATNYQVHPESQEFPETPVASSLKLTKAGIAELKTKVNWEEDWLLDPEEMQAQKRLRDQFEDMTKRSTDMMACMQCPIGLCLASGVGGSETPLA